MKRIGILSMALAAMLTVACGGGRDDRENPNNDSAAVGTAGENPTAASADKNNASVSRGSQDWVNDLLIANMAEVKLGELATTKAANADVKAFGRMMVQDHTKAGDELKQIASTQNITAPTDLDDKHRDLSEKLSKLQGAEFDREYMNAMVDGHQDVLDKLEDRLDKSGDDKAPSYAPKKTDDQFDMKLNTWAANAAPVVNKHLERAKALKDKVGRRMTNDNDR